MKKYFENFKLLKKLYKVFALFLQSTFFFQKATFQVDVLTSNPIPSAYLSLAGHDLM